MKILLVLFLLVLGLPAWAAGPILSIGAGSGGGGGTSRAFVPLHTYFMAPTTATPAGNDGNVGDATHPWATPNHSVVCGDVIIAAAGTYPETSWNFSSQPTTCPSTTGGIDGTGGIWFAIVLCGGADLEACQIAGSNPSCGGGSCPLVNIPLNNWAIEGFKCNGGGGGTNRCFVSDGSFGPRNHHTAYINDIAYNTRQGYEADDGGVSHSTTNFGADYWATVGSIAQNAAQDGICLGAVDPAGGMIDQASGTHHLIYGVFSYNIPNNGCAGDQSALFYDTADSHGDTNDWVMLNNMAWLAYRVGTDIFTQQNNSITGIHYYMLNNTTFNNLLSGQSFGELTIGSENASPINVVAQNNIHYATQGNACAVEVGDEGSGHGPANLANITVGGVGVENIVNAPNAPIVLCFNDGYSQPSQNNITTDPLFRNGADLLSNRSGVPNCAGFINVTQCMGWNAITNTLLTPSGASCPGGFTCVVVGASGAPVIFDLMATCTQCTGKGYQLPSTTCASSGVVSTHVPTWLKGVVYLHWTGSAVVQNFDLVTLPCGL